MFNFKSVTLPLSLDHAWFIYLMAIFFFVKKCFSHSTRLLAATTLRNVLGTKILADILSERQDISHGMQVHILGRYLERICSP